MAGTRKNRIQSVEYGRISTDHRFSELDGVLWMEQGTILAGSHETLMGTCPAYAGLYNAQKGGDGRGE